MAVVDLSEISPKEIVALAKDAEHSLWWMFVESWLKQTLEQAKYHKDKAGELASEEGYREFIRWQAIEKATQELLNLRTGVVAAFQKQSAIKERNTNPPIPVGAN